MQLLRSIVSDLQSRGLTVEFRDIGQGRVALFMVEPGNLAAAQQLVEHKTIPLFEVGQNLSQGSSVLDTVCAQLDLSLVVLGALGMLNVRTVRQLITLSRSDLLAVDGFGPRSLEEIEGQLMFLGLRLRNA